MTIHYPRRSFKACLLVATATAISSSIAHADTSTPPSIFKKVYSFSTASGVNPAVGLIKGRDGSYYGTAQSGGTSNLGIVYKLSARGQVSVLHSFANCGLEGCNPANLLAEGSDGALYGTTQSGGTNNAGVIYRITKSGGFSVLYNFTDCTKNGCNPQAGLTVAKNGTLYGTTANGGQYGAGVFFSITTDGVYTLLNSLPSCDIVCNPSDELVAGTDGKFYGLSYKSNTLYSLATDGTLASVMKFSDCTKTGCNPRGLRQASDGTFYGVTAGGGTQGQGTVWSYKPGTGLFTLLASFTGTNGSSPTGAPLLIGNTLYGATKNGGDSGNGTIYRLPIGGTVSVLYSFRSDGIIIAPHDPQHPVGAPVSYLGSVLVGVTSNGGDNGQGGVYLITPLR